MLQLLAKNALHSCCVPIILCTQDSIGDLHHLTELDFKNNQLEEIPASIGRLRKLVVLNVTNNCLPNLPTSIGRLAGLEELGLQ